ncbi:MAG TPA: nitrilase-related carbon-nitrogen hydrolase [Terriglobia bacterium]|nr:nitrilase-related carbon-nitrogen hydrolase [Terriglobia bacterium]
MNKNLIKIGLIQTKVGENVEENLERTAGFVKQAARKGAEIVCLQELFASRYFAQIKDDKFFELAETVPGRLSQFLSECATANRVLLIGGSIYEKDGGKFYNTSLIYDSSGALAGRYRKMHIPHDPNYYEQYYFSPGDLGYVQVKAGKTVVAPLICYDQWYPEAARVNAIQGAQVIFYPTAIGWFKELRRDEPFSAKRWENAMRAHASLNGIFVAAVNRVGREGGLRFWGGSFIADPFGEVLARASHSKEEVLVAKIDLGRISVSQEGWRFLHNRRPQSYTDLVR